MSRIVRARTEHIRPMATLMAASPLLRRYRVTPRGAKASLTEALRERDLVLAAVDRGAVVGLAWLIMTRALDRAAYLRLLLVSEEHQSQGLGAVLLARNRRARSFYERHGYTHVGDLPGFVRAGIAESLYLKTWRA